MKCIIITGIYVKDPGGSQDYHPADLYELGGYDVWAGREGRVWVAKLNPSPVKLWRQDIRKAEITGDYDRFVLKSNMILLIAPFESWTLSPKALEYLYASR